MDEKKLLEMVLTSCIRKEFIRVDPAILLSAEGKGDKLVQRYFEHKLADALLKREDVGPVTVFSFKYAAKLAADYLNSEEIDKFLELTTLEGEPSKGSLKGTLFALYLHATKVKTKSKKIEAYRILGNIALWYDGFYRKQTKRHKLGDYFAQMGKIGYYNAAVWSMKSKRGDPTQVYKSMEESFDIFSNAYNKIMKEKKRIKKVTVGEIDCNSKYALDEMLEGVMPKERRDLAKRDDASFILNEGFELHKDRIIEFEEKIVTYPKTDIKQ